MEYIKAVRYTIFETKAHYSFLEYKSENLCNIPDSEIQFIDNDQLFLERSNPSLHSLIEKQRELEEIRKQIRDSTEGYSPDQSKV